MINFVHNYGQVARMCRYLVGARERRGRFTDDPTGFAQLAGLLTDADDSAGEPIPVAIERWRQKNAADG
jgi:hypothetical protein